MSTSPPKTSVVRTQSGTRDDIIESSVVEAQEHVQETRWHAIRTQAVQFLAIVALPYLIVRCVLELVGVVTVYYILPLINRSIGIYPDPRIKHFPDMLWLMWDHFDSGFYLSIVHTGYWGKASLHSSSNWAFFPLYPILIRLVATPFAHGTADDTYRLAALVVSNIAALAACTYLYKITKLEFGSSIAVRAVIYLGLFPLSFYLTAIYPESLFLALSIGSVYYARTRHWWLAGILGGLASLTRPQGVLLFAVVAWEYWQWIGERYAPMQTAMGMVAIVQEWLRSRLLGLWRSLASWRTWLGFAALLLIPLGLVLFVVYAKLMVGSFLAFQEVEKYGWGRGFANPILFALHMIHHPLPASPANWDFYGLNITAVILFFLMLIPIFRKLPPVYGIFSLFFLLMPLTSGELNSIARYYMEVFPVYMVLALWTSQDNAVWSERKHTLLVASFAVLLALGMVMFTLGIYSMA